MSLPNSIPNSIPRCHRHSSLPNFTPKCLRQTSLQRTFQTPSRDVTSKVAPACHSQVRSSMSLPNFISKCLSQTPFQSTFQTSLQDVIPKCHSKLFQVGKGSAGGREGAGKEPEDVSSFAPTARFARAPTPPCSTICVAGSLHFILLNDAR